MKLTPGWAFQHFCWDYVIGIIAASLLWGLTLGSNGGAELSFIGNIGGAGATHITFALLCGTVFNIANLLLVPAIDITGLAVAFPVGIGLVLAVGVLLNYLISPQGNPRLSFGEVLLPRHRSCRPIRGRPGRDHDFRDVGSLCVERIYQCTFVRAKADTTDVPVFARRGDGRAGICEVTRATTDEGTGTYGRQG